MEPTDRGLGPYYHHQPPPPPPHYPHHQLPPQPQPSSATDTRLYPHTSVPSAISSPLTGLKRKRGRPRKYSTPEQAAAAKRLSSLPSPSSTTRPLSLTSKNDKSPAVGISPSSRKSSLGNAGQGFTPYIINATGGEDVNLKIISFVQQSKQEICVVSASGVISNACLRQPATSGGNITYEGRFEILSLCGSYVRADLESRSGGLSICMSSNDGQIIGGGVDGPLIAAGPVQVIVGTFVISGKNTATVTKDDNSIGASVSSLSLPSARDSIITDDDNQQNGNGYPFIIPNGGMPVTSPQSMTDWRINNDSRTTDAFNLSGRF